MKLFVRSFKCPRVFNNTIEVVICVFTPISIVNAQIFVLVPILRGVLAT
jgi:hypothetical protein